MAAQRVQIQALGVKPPGNPMMEEAVPAVSANMGLGNVSVDNEESRRTWVLLLLFLLYITVYRKKNVFVTSEHLSI